MSSYAQDTVFAFLTATLQAASKAIDACQRLDIKRKSDNSLVSAADLASNKAIITQVQKHYPDSLLFSEETQSILQNRKKGAYVWVIDPIDGTTNFLNSYPYYCISLALGKVQANGKIAQLAGGILNPNDNTTYLAYRGGGAYRNGKRMAVAKARAFADCFLASGSHYDIAHLPHLQATYLKVAKAVTSIRFDGSSALDLAMVARGTFDAYWEEGLHAWDVAAGTLLVLEAGGTVRNYNSNSPFDIEAGSVIAGSASAVARLQELVGG